MARYIPTEKELKQKVKLVSVKVKGDYIAAIDERRKTSRRYNVEVLAPEGFGKPDLKRLTPRVLREHKDYADFVSMRDFHQDGPAKKTDKTMIREDLYSRRELDRFKKSWDEVAEDKKKEAKALGNKEKGIPGDVTEYDEDTGLPKVINDDPADEE